MDRITIAGFSLITGLIGGVLLAKSDIFADHAPDKSLGIIRGTAFGPLERSVQVDFLDGHKQLYSIPDTSDVPMMLRIGDTVRVWNVMDSMEIGHPLRYETARPVFASTNR